MRFLPILYKFKTTIDFEPPGRLKQNELDQIRRENNIMTNELKSIREGIKTLQGATSSAIYELQEFAKEKSEI